jgi:ribonuclease R
MISSSILVAAADRINDVRLLMSNKKRNKDFGIKDPFAKREAEKYQHPIPSREFILQTIEEYGAPIHFNELKKILAINNDDKKVALRRRLIAMVRDQQLDRVNRNYCKKGFIDQYNATLNFEKYDNNKKIIHIAAKLFEINGYIYAAPFFSKDFSQDILIAEGHLRSAKIGDYVMIEVAKPLFKWADPLGKVIKVIAQSDNRKALTNVAIAGLDIPHSWPEEVNQQLKQIEKKANLAASKSRVNLTKLAFVTIDGEETKDFDDAVYCEPSKLGGWRLYVAIADVSHYVVEDSELDVEARLRGNSVYFPGRVIPILPELLSNDLCSLKPNVKRLCLVCEMEISKAGKLSKYKFYDAIINSNARLTYTQVDQILSAPAKQRNKLYNLSPKVISNLANLYNLFTKLYIQRKKRGAIEFETVEGKLVFNKNGKITDIQPQQRNVAHKIIEECMLSANVATADFLEQNKLLSIYRIHEGPKAIKLVDLQAFLAGVGLSLGDTDAPTPQDYAKLLQSITERHDADVIQMILLRSLCQAIYSTNNVGHFGLAYSAYTHFTSPIRRYTDLLIHRQIKALLAKQQLKASVEDLKAIAEHCSMTERRADDATREVIKALKCQYLAKYIGEKFTGIVSGVTKFGLFIEIKDLYIDGLVHINSLGEDYFIHDPVHHKLIGERNGIIYCLGMELQVIVSSVDLNKRRIDFVLEKRSSKVTRKKSKTKQSSISRSKQKRSTIPKTKKSKRPKKSRTIKQGKQHVKKSTKKRKKSKKNK